MYDQIVDVYDQIFPLNQGFLDFIPPYLGDRGSKILDLGCGPGEYVDRISRRGYTITGIDSSQEMIRRANEEKQGTFYPYSFMDIYKLSETFNCAYSIGNSLSYLANDPFRAFLAELAQHLETGGYFVLQVVNWDKYRVTGSANFPIKTLTEGRTFHRRYEPKDDEAVIFHTALKTGETVEAAWSDALYPKYLEPTVTELESAGLEVTGQYGNYKKAPYSTEESPAMILVAQKQKIVAKQPLRRFLSWIARNFPDNGPLLPYFASERTEKG
ncbi:MAG: Cypemycin N-terminal methyltransferase [Chloroflexi bacterium]|nr:Cypemycin N-terminal methyltransferase [Chloroflexota bacterium]